MCPELLFYSLQKYVCYLTEILHATAVARYKLQNYNIS